MSKRRQLVFNAINLIEDHLDSINVDTVCQNFEGSKWEFQRLFSALINESIGNYIRKRRLTVAAEKIINFPSARVLDIAIEANFSSQEAFARAFKVLFSVSPTEIATNLPLYRRYKKNRIEENQLLHIDENIEKAPEIIYYDKPRYFVGISTNINNFFSDDPDYIDLAPKLWQKFSTERKNIEDRIRGLSFGFAIESSGQLIEDKFKYLAATQVTSIEKIITPHLETLTIPAGHYAQFKNQGHPYNSKFTINFIYGAWLQKSDYQRPTGHDYEIFDQNFDINKNSASLYCIPVTLKP